MRIKLASLALTNSLLFVAMAAVGFPGILANAVRLPSEVTIRALEQGQPVDNGAVDAAAARLTTATIWSNAAHYDLALAILAQGGVLTDHVAGDHAARQLRIYLASVPDDSLAWSNLALAESRKGTSGAAAAAYKMSIELAPASSSNLAWRCAFGIDIYSALDDAGKTLLARQCQLAMDPSLGWDVSHGFIVLLKQKGAVEFAKALIAGDPEAGKRFESLIASNP